MTQAAALAAYGSNSPSNRNRIINGDMRIDQRNAGAAVTTPDVYVTDRWQQFAGGGGAITWQQSSTAPAGFKYSLSATVTTADSSLGTSDYYFLRQFIEGFNSADLEFGTADAKTVTLSFWVRSSLTGTFGGSLHNGGGNRFYPFTYSISTTDTWEYKTITIAGDTTGTWLTTNGAGLGVDFSLGFGSNFIGTAGSWTASQHYTATGATSVVGTSGATFYITGVQLEEGSVATPFENRQYGTELALCQRYYGKVQVLYLTSAWASIANTAYWRVEMRANPTIVSVPSSGTGGSFSTQGDTNAAFQNNANSGLAGGYITGSAEL